MLGPVSTRMVGHLHWAYHFSTSIYILCNQVTFTQPATLSGMEKEYQRKGGEALWEMNKSRCGLFHLDKCMGAM